MCQNKRHQGSHSRYVFFKNFTSLISMLTVIAITTIFLLAAENHDNKEREDHFLSSVREGEVDFVQEMVSQYNFYLSSPLYITSLVSQYNIYFSLSLYITSHWSVNTTFISHYHCILHHWSVNTTFISHHHCILHHWSVNIQSKCLISNCHQRYDASWLINIKS
jgi:hypothetical protein